MSSLLSKKEKKLEKTRKVAQYTLLLHYCIASVIRQSFFPSKTIPKNLDLAYKTDLEFWKLFRKGKTCIIAKFRKGKTCIIAKFYTTGLVI